MIIPCRVRRRLLLPPGWVGLGFLLLLGCLLLRQLGLRQWNVIQVTLPQLHVDKAAHWNSVVYQSPEQLGVFRPWHDIQFGGGPLSNFLAAATTESATREIIADTNQVGGVRVRFLAGATYANLIKGLDIMRYTDQRKYWLDVRHQPLTLYAITVKPARLKNAEARVYLSCCTCGSYLPKPEMKGAWLLKLQNLWLRQWRPTTILLALIGILSLWPLLRRRPVFTLNH